MLSRKEGKHQPAFKIWDCSIVFTSGSSSGKPSCTDAKQVSLSNGLTNLVANFSKAHQLKGYFSNSGREREVEETASCKYLILIQCSTLERTTGTKQRSRQDDNCLKHEHLAFYEGRQSR